MCGNMGHILEMIIKFMKLNWDWSRKKREHSNYLTEIRRFKRILRAIIWEQLVDRHNFYKRHKHTL